MEEPLSAEQKPRSLNPRGEWLTVQSSRPDELYTRLLDVAVGAGVQEMFSPDEDLESVFRYLVAR